MEYGVHCKVIAVKKSFDIKARVPKPRVKKPKPAGHAPHGPEDGHGGQEKQEACHGVAGHGLNAKQDKRGSMETKNKQYTEKRKT